MHNDDATHGLGSYRAFSSDGHAARWRPWDAGPESAEHELLTLAWENEAWTASGAIERANAHDTIHYVVRISPTWHVRQFLLFRDMDEPDLWLGTDGHGRWGEMNGDHRPELDGCVDIALRCTPFTNSLPIRRLPLHVGHAADITVAVIDVETLDVQPDHVRYTRLASHHWRYDRLIDGSVEPGSTQLFDVDEHGLVIDSPSLFRRIN